METTLARITKYSFRKKHRQSLLLTKLLPTLLVGVTAYAISTLSPAPLVMKSSQRIFSEGLKIELDRTSPAFAAMEDTLLGNQLTDFDSTSMMSQPSIGVANEAFSGANPITGLNLGGEDLVPVDMLIAGERSAVAMVASIQHENRREELLAAQAKIARKAQENLMIQAATHAFEEMATKFATGSPTAAAVASVARNGVAAAVTNLPDVGMKIASFAQRSTDTQALVDTAELKTFDAPNEPTEVSKTIHLAEIGMSREQFMREFFMPLATSDSSDVPPKTMVAGGVPFHSRSANRGAGSFSNLANTPDSFGRVGGTGNIHFVRSSGLGTHSGSGGPTNGVPVIPATSYPSRPFENDDGLLAQSIRVPSKKSKGAGISANEEPAFANQEPTSPKPSSNSENPVSDISNGTQQLTIAGQFEFSNGLALTNPADNVVIFRENDGQVFEQAAVFIKKASYEIFMEKPEGDLVAELRNPQGDLLGRARFELSKLNQQAAKNPCRMSGINLKIVPVPQGVGGQVLALGATGIQPIADARVAFESLPYDVGTKKTGRFEEPNLMEGSAVTLEVHHRGYLPTKVKAFAGIDNRVILLSEKSIRALQAMQPESRDHSTATILGTVTKAHTAVSGAQVMLSTAGEERKVIYFNDKNEPDPALEATGPNGMYVVYGVGAADQKIQATWGSNQSETIVVTAHDRFSEQADLELTEARTAKLRVFDAFRTDWPLAAQIQAVGSEDPSVHAPRDSSGTMKFKTSQRGLMLDIDAGQNYEISRMIVDRDRKSIYLPMIQTSWLEQMRGTQKVSNEIRAGTVIGFIQGNAPFEVQMDENSVGRSSKLYYFNRQGEITKQNFGEPGGGFIIFNLPEGSRSLMVQAKGMSKAYTATVQVESRVTNVINHWMR